MGSKSKYARNLSIALTVLQAADCWQLIYIQRLVGKEKRNFAESGQADKHHSHVQNPDWDLAGGQMVSAQGINTSEQKTAIQISEREKGRCWPPKSVQK